MIIIYGSKTHWHKSKTINNSTIKLKLCVNTFALKKCMYVSRTTMDLGPNSMPFLKL